MQELLHLNMSYLPLYLQQALPLVSQHQHYSVDALINDGIIKLDLVRLWTDDMELEDAPHILLNTTFQDGECNTFIVKGQCFHIRTDDHIYKTVLCAAINNYSNTIKYMYDNYDVSKYNLGIGDEYEYEDCPLWYIYNNDTELFCYVINKIGLNRVISNEPLWHILFEYVFDDEDILTGITLLKKAGFDFSDKHNLVQTIDNKLHEYYNSNECLYDIENKIISTLIDAAINDDTNTINVLYKLMHKND